MLHAHVPFGPPGSQAETWFVEAAIECWLPLAQWLRATPEARVTVSFSPTSLAWLERGDRAILDGLEAKLGRLRALHATAPDAVDAQLAHLEPLRDAVVSEGAWPMVRALAELPWVELATTAATHGFLPLLSGVPEAVRAQLEVGREAFTRAFGVAPRGRWLPECGYFPGLEQVLAEEQVRWFVVEASAFARASPPSPTQRPVFTETGVAAFARDPLTGELVWSANVGYPGHRAHLEFHRREQGERLWRVGDGAPYQPDESGAVVATQAEDFVTKIAEQGADAVITAAYDAELFGHWWHEGPRFLAEVVRRATGRVRLVTPSGVLAERQEARVVALPDSSWGEGGGRSTWLAPENAWAWPHLERAAERMEAAARRFEPGPGLGAMARALLLAQASDWPFLLAKRTNQGFAQSRLEAHLLELSAAADALEQGRPPPSSDAFPFPWLDGRVYRGRTP